MNRRLLIALPGLLLAAPALAHTGHPDGGGLLSVIVHPFAGADHLLAMMAVCVMAMWAGGRLLWALPATFLATMMAGAALALGGVQWLFFEPALTAGVLALGALALRLGRRPVASVSPA